MKNKKALITGVNGQDGSYLTELLLEKGYEVHGLMRRTSHPNTRNLRHILYNKEIFGKTFHLHDGDLGDHTSLTRLIKQLQPDEVYNFAAMAGVGPSFSQPAYSMDITATSVGVMLEAIRLYSPHTKFFQAGSSHVFGDTPVSPQNESTPFQPISPYGVAKASSLQLLHMYREAYGIFACGAIYYAHASPRYSESFLLSKIVHSLWKIKKGEISHVRLGNLDVPMDIGYAKEYMEATYNIMQQEKPDVYVIGTGETHTSREFLDAALDEAGLKFEDVVKLDESLKRPSEVSVLVADYSKAKEDFGFDPQVKFRDLVELMYEDRKQN